MNIDEDRFRGHVVMGIQKITGLSRHKAVMLYEVFKRADRQKLMDMMERWLLGKLDTEATFNNAGENVADEICEKYDLK